MTLQFRVNSWIDSLVKRKMIQRNHTNNSLGVLESLAGLLKNWMATETPRLMKFKGRSSLLAFLINADLPFLCDSASLWPISPFSRARTVRLTELLHVPGGASTVRRAVDRYQRRFQFPADCFSLPPESPKNVHAAKAG